MPESFTSSHEGTSLFPKSTVRSQRPIGESFWALTEAMVDESKKITINLRSLLKKAFWKIPISL
jgi:hypothetical protein